MSMTDPHAGAHLTHDELVLHLFHDDEGPARAQAEAHLHACADCQAEHECLAAMLAVVSAHIDEPAPPGFERVMWARVQARLAVPAAETWWHWLGGPRLVLPVGAMVLVLAAFAAGRWTGAPVPPAAPVTTAGLEPAERVLVDAAGEHLERTQAVLIELMNAESGGPLRAADRARAADLLAASRLIRQSAAASGETALAGVLDELERVLMAMANDGDDWSAGERDVLRTRIESRDLLFRTRVVGAEMRERVARWD